ncbi:MAG: tRNA 2-thiouridine(34) synthase MnmA [Verrucomicrobiia bacterium]
MVLVNENKKQVVIGLSGGVDSSAAAALLLEQGYEVIGITLKMWGRDCVNRSEDKCCGPQAVMDARAICSRLGIPYYVIDDSERFKKEVIEYFAAEYKMGRTPNPCVVCNEKIKFGTLIASALQLGAEFVATGHFARVEYSHQSGRYLLKRGLDLKKDQSYFLFSLRQQQLARACFPLGNLTKNQSRELASKYNLKTAQKQESQEICFVPDGDYAGFLMKSGLAAARKGEIVDLSGRVLGYHDGVHLFTIGQRKGIKIPAPKPYYVVDIDAQNNRVIVGTQQDLVSDRLKVERCNWIMFDNPPQKLEVIAKIRYNHPGAQATVFPQQDGTAIVHFHTPQRAITPGQACVFFIDDVVVGGGWIVKEK